MSQLVSKEKGIYSDDDRREAVAQYLMLGTYKKVGQAMNIPRSTVWKWGQSEWWAELIQEAKAAVSDRFKARCRTIIEEGTEEILDRIENGNEVNTKHGIARMKVSAGELAKVSGIFYDKLRIEEGLPTSIIDSGGSKKMLESLADEFRRISERNNRVVSDQ